MSNKVSPNTCQRVSLNVQVLQVHQETQVKTRVHQLKQVPKNECVMVPPVPVQKGLQTKDS